MNIRSITCHPERSGCCAKRNIHGVEGPRAAYSEVTVARHFRDDLQYLVDTLPKLAFGNRVPQGSSGTLLSFRDPTW